MVGMMTQRGNKAKTADQDTLEVWKKKREDE